MTERERGTTRSGDGADDEGPGDTTSGTASVVAASGTASGRDHSDHEGWQRLPATVRTMLVDIAGRVLGTLDAAVVPPLLARVARFTPAKRGRAGAVPLARALGEDAGFRALVASALPSDFGRAGGDPVARAVRAYLTGTEDLADALAEVAAQDEAATLRAQVAELAETVETLTARLARAAQGGPGGVEAGAGGRRGRRGGGSPGSGGDGADPDGAEERALAEAAKLRARLREQGTRLRAVTDEAAAQVAEAESVRDAAVAEAERERVAAAKWRARAEAAEERARMAQLATEQRQEQADRERGAADRRVELLLDAVNEAARGLRREWRVRAGGADPADLVADDYAARTTIAERTADPALLGQWLTLPRAHLIVDGYNVTKTGYPDLALAEQRDRLTRALEGVAARTGAEVTVVFDGAAVVVPPAATKRVRVVFSPPGVIADDVIRRMAAAEPVGRTVVVVSSDREVGDGARRSGARVASSAVLLGLLGQQ